MVPTHGLSCRICPCPSCSPFFSSNAGLSALRQAVGVDACEDKKSAPTAVVRYTGLVGAIDSYLDTVISWDTADVALRLDSGEVGDISPPNNALSPSQLEPRFWGRN